MSEKTKLFCYRDFVRKDGLLKFVKCSYDERKSRVIPPVSALWAHKVGLMEFSNGKRRLGSLEAQNRVGSLESRAGSCLEY